MVDVHHYQSGGFQQRAAVAAGEYAAGSDVGQQGGFGCAYVGGVPHL